MKESKYEELLNINTCGEQLWSEKIKHYHPYQATSYEALEKLFEKYQTNEEDYVVDFGCGKGRLNFYINYFFKASVTGVEMDKGYYEECIINKERYINKNNRKSDKINFECCFAQDYKIKAYENKFYFFNPFSVQIFRRIIDNILESYYENERKIELILYYPSDDYIYYIDNCTPFLLKDEVRLDYLYDSDSQERFLIYELMY